MKNSILLFLLLGSVIPVFGQSLVEDPAITQLMESFMTYNKSISEVRGWRVQIMSTTDRRMMEDAQAKFKRRYPEYDVVFEHQNPYYHLKTGAFLTQQDARPLLKKLQRDFPAAFLVSDEFDKLELLKYLE
jgi:hypothetical protein